jgi:cytidylate kinase
MIITVDGPAGSGKSTVARLVARELGLPYLNSGFIYRAVTLLVLEAGLADRTEAARPAAADGAGGEESDTWKDRIFSDKEKVAELIRSMDLRFEENGDRTRVYVGSREVTQRLRDPDVTPEIYRIADDGFYRRLLIDVQRQAALPDGVVTEGRDMGTVIFPDAEHKFYLEATTSERAGRHWKDLQRAGHPVEFADLLKEVEQRDARDRGRTAGPLRMPEGAMRVDTEGLTAEQVVEILLANIRASA